MRTSEPVLMDPFILAFTAKGLNAAIHKHSAFQIVFSHENQFNSILNQEENKQIFGFIAKPQISHACSENNSLLSIVNIEPFSPPGKFIQGLFQPDENYIPFKSQTDFAQFLNMDALTHFEDTLHQLVRNNQFTPELDERVTGIIQHIRTHYHEKINLKLLSEMVYLSPSRLSALFKLQTGSSLSRYLLWTRIREAIRLSLSEKHLQLTEIAFKTGFYDLAQLNKYMYEMIGVPPKGFRNYSDLIQI